MKAIQLKLEDAQVEVLTKAFKTLNRFNWIKALRAAGFVTADEAEHLKSALHSLADQLGGGNDAKQA